MKKEKGHILMTGGGTLGPVTPLIGIAQEWKRHNPQIRISWIGTPSGPERAIIEEYGYAFTAINAPKLSRSRIWTWLFIPILFVFSFVRAYKYLKHSRPEVIFSAGGYVSIPVVFAGRLLGIPSWIHQLDAVPGIANRLMALVATKISITWEQVPKELEKYEPIYAGSVVRSSLYNGEGIKLRNTWNFSEDKPTVLIFGGGTGATSINRLLETIGSKIADIANVIHVTGKGKMLPGLLEVAENYTAVEFAGKEMADYFSAADLVVGRAGMGTILEVCALRKPSMLIPLHNTDQLANAKVFEEAGAGKVLWQINGQILLQELRKFIEDTDSQKKYIAHSGMLFKDHGERLIVKKVMELLDSE